MKYPLENWLPYKLNFDANEMLCEWLFVGDKTFDEPFFESTIQECKNLPENQSKFTSISNVEAITAFSENEPYLHPKAFIFHVSRSGSTLLSQLFSLDPANIVVAEAPFFDQILREIAFSKFEYSEEKISELFKAAINLYGKKRLRNEQNYFVKLDSWHMMYYEIIRKAFPSTPFIFSYRKPSEVINSHMKQPGLQAVPGLLQPSIFKIKLNDKLLIDKELFITKVLEKYFEKLMKIAKTDENILLIDYADGIFINIEHIKRYLKIKIEQTVKNEMKVRSEFHSKKPNEVFSEKISENVLPDFQKKVEDLYQNLKNNAKASLYSTL